MTAAQCRAARALLDWTQSDLAYRARVALSTIADFERGAREPTFNNIRHMIEAFKLANVQFVKGGVVAGGAILARSTGDTCPYCTLEIKPNQYVRYPVAGKGVYAHESCAFRAENLV